MSRDAFSGVAVEDAMVTRRAPAEVSMRRASVLVAAILIAYSAGSVPADGATTGYDTENGAVEGLIAVGPQLVSKRVRFNLYEDQRRNAPVKVAQPIEAELANVVVYLEDDGGALARVARDPGTHVMRQESSSFVPHVLPVAVGATVEFPNTDPVFHNVFSLSKAAAFDLGRYPRGDSRSVRLEQPGIVKVFCHIHSDMTGVLMVLPHSFFAVPDSDGRYRIDGIPPGRYTLVGWHERARRAAQSIVVEPGRSTIVHLAIPLSQEDGR
jgi:plastocyanin